MTVECVCSLVHTTTLLWCALAFSISFFTRLSISLLFFLSFCKITRWSCITVCVCVQTHTDRVELIEFGTLLLLCSGCPLFSSAQMSFCLLSVCVSVCVFAFLQCIFFFCCSHLCTFTPSHFQAHLLAYVWLHFHHHHRFLSDCLSSVELTDG